MPSSMMAASISATSFFIGIPSFKFAAEPHFSQTAYPLLSTRQRTRKKDTANTPFNFPAGSFIHTSIITQKKGKFNSICSLFSAFFEGNGIKAEMQGISWARRHFGRPPNIRKHPQTALKTLGFLKICHPALLHECSEFRN